MTAQVHAQQGPASWSIPAAQAPTQTRSVGWERVTSLPWDKFGIVLLVAYSIAPFFWLIRLSMDPTANGKIFPSKFTLTNYTDLLSSGDFMHAFLNSIIVSGSATILALMVGGCAGYALARLPVPGKQYILFSCLAVSMFPSISIVGPLFDLWRKIGLFDTKMGLILPTVTFALPMAIWIMQSFFKELPRDLEHAAYMDGATPFQAFRHVMLPLAAPGVFTAAILVFIAAWNEFLFAITFTATNKSFTIPAAIAHFQGKSDYEVPVGAIAAASVFVMIPVLTMVLIFQRRIVAGLTAGGVKG